MKLRVLVLAGCCVASISSAHAGLLTDDKARKQIQELEARISKLEKSPALVDLQTQIDTLNADMRKLRGQNEELAHDLQDAEKRQKDFYIDLDTRLRRFEAVDNADNTVPAQPAAVSGGSAAGAIAQQPAQPAAVSNVPAAKTMAQQPAAVSNVPATKTMAQQPATGEVPATGVMAQKSAAESGAPTKPAMALESDPVVVEDRAYESGYAFYRANSYQNAINAFQEFLKKFPDSIFVPNVHFWMGNSYFALKDYKNSLTSYQLLIDKYSYSPKMPDAMLAAANCRQQLKSVKAAKKTLKQLIAKYPHSEAAGKAKTLLKTLK
jgi:tol-pal system protein YbgF